MEGLRQEGVSDEVISALQGDVGEFGFLRRDQALFLLAQTLTVGPGTADVMTRKAVEAGWSEDEVASAIFIVSYFNMVTRIASGFGLPPDESHPFDPATVLPMLQCE